MSKKPSFDFEGFEKNMDRVARRIQVLEKEYKKESSFIKSRDERLIVLKEGFEEQIKGIRSDLESIRDAASFLSKSMRSVGRGMQNVAKKDQLKKINERIDAWPLEHFVKRDEL